MLFRSDDGVPQPRIDAHHHLWHYTAEEYPWIDEGMAVLRCDFLLQDLKTVCRDARVSATVAVQARQTVEETEWLLSFAVDGSPIAGVVGWLPLTDPDLSTRFAHLLAAPRLKGLRHVVQAEAPGFLDGEAFNRGIRALRGTGLVYDILILPPQMEEATRFVDRHPDQIFVLDHMAKPPIRTGDDGGWSVALRELARRPNLFCKLSGLVSEADPKHWTPDGLAPYAQVALEAFGPQRLMIGTDWPVLTEGCSYAQWWRTVETWIAPLSADEQAQILGGTAMRVYRLQDTPDAGKETA